MQATETAPAPVPLPSVLVAETNDVRPFARLLRGIGLKHNAVMEISEAGFAVTVEEVRTLCAIAWIPKNLFSRFEFHPPSDPATFELSLDALLQCLNIFGNAGAGSNNNAGASLGGGGGRSKRRWAGEGEVEDLDDTIGGSTGSGSGGGGDMRRNRDRRTGMRLEWPGFGSDLSILLTDEARGPTTNCLLKTLQPEELMNAQFDQDKTALYLIMKSEWFRDALLDLPPSSTRITFIATPPSSTEPELIPDATISSNGRRIHNAQVGKFRIKAEGDFGTTELDYPNDKDVMDKFESDQPVTHSYHSSHIALLQRALHQSVKICLQIENEGFLCVQIMMPMAEDVEVGGHSGILEFKMHALEEDD